MFGVSILDEKSKAKFAGKHGLTFPLLADADHEVAEKYGVWQEKARYGRKYMGIVRTTYLIGPDGKVAQRWDKVKVDGHADEVAKAAAALKRRMLRRANADRSSRRLAGRPPALPRRRPTSPANGRRSTTKTPSSACRGRNSATTPACR